MADQTATARRPAIMSLVGIVLYIWAAMVAIEAIALFLNLNDEKWQNVYGSDNDILVAALVQTVIALAIFFVGFSVMSGAKWSRLGVAIIVGIRLVTATWFVLNHLGNGAFTWQTVLSLGIGIFILWALYAKDESVAFYEGHP